MTAPVSPAASTASSARRLSGPELALWRLQQAAPETGAWNMALAVYVIGRGLHVPTLDRAVTLLARRHPALRTTFPLTDDGPVAHEAPPEQVTLEVAIRGRGHGLWRDEVRTAAGRPFDLAREFPFRAALVRHAGYDTLVLALHQLAGDWWTLGRLFQELAGAYRVLRSGDPEPAGPPAPAGPAPAAEPSPAAMMYWQDRLVGWEQPAPALAVGAGDPTRPTFTGALLTHPLGATAHRSARSLAARLRVDEQTVLLAGYFALLHYHGAGPDLVVGVPMPAPDASGAGYAGAPVPVRVALDRNRSFGELAAEVETACVEAADHRDLPTGAVLPEPTSSGAPPPPFRHVFSGHPVVPAGYVSLAGPPARAAPAETGYSWPDLALLVDLEPGRATARLHYRTELFGPDDARSLIQRYAGLLCHAAAAPDRRLSDLDWWTSADRAVVAGARARGDTAVVRDVTGCALPPGVRGEVPTTGGIGHRRYDGELELLS